jgi:hypothetical protein
MHARACLTVALSLSVVHCGDDETAAQTDPGMTFFVTSDTSPTGDLGGLPGADARCARLAKAVGAGDRTWRAYLSVEHDPDRGGAATDARSRIGRGPWVNALGATLANDLDALHAREGDAALFVDESSRRIPGFWPDSPSPVEHDVLTGSTVDGAVFVGRTCRDWTSSSASDVAEVGHTDGLDNHGERRDTLVHWNAAHASKSCADTGPGGGAGRIYCFAED